MPVLDTNTVVKGTVVCRLESQEEELLTNTEVYDLAVCHQVEKLLCILLIFQGPVRTITFIDPIEVQGMGKVAVLRFQPSLFISASAERYKSSSWAKSTKAAAMPTMAEAWRHACTCSGYKSPHFSLKYCAMPHSSIYMY